MTGDGDEADAETGFHLLGLPAADESHELRSREPFEVLVSQFVEELRSGKRPSSENYARRFPPHADRIREVFPVLAALEIARIEREARTVCRHMPERFPFTRIGHCELLRELGRGGMGVVYDARDVESGHRVAVKILPWRVAIAPDQVERFEQEARIASQLRHRNIVPVYRYGQENGYCFLVMQLINGKGLDRVIELLRQSDGVVAIDDVALADSTTSMDRDTSLDAADRKSQPQTADTPRRVLTTSSWNSFARIGLQAAQALHAAHAAGILHNDIKPGNLLLDGTGHVWVSDFGLSRSVDDADKSIGDRTVSGTLRYMAPERLSGEHSAACDVYALGATLYELCLQQPLFAETDRDALVQLIRSQSPRRPRDIRRDFPTGLETVILNCLARDPDSRYSTSADLVTDLLKFTHGEPVRSKHRRTLRRFADAIRKWIAGLRTT